MLSYYLFSQGASSGTVEVAVGILSNTLPSFNKCVDYRMDGRIHRRKSLGIFTSKNKQARKDLERKVILLLAP